MPRRASVHWTAARYSVSPTVAQSLARHSTITLTIDAYSHDSHADSGERGTPVRSLPAPKVGHTTAPTGTGLLGKSKALWFAGLEATAPWREWKSTDFACSVTRCVHLLYDG